MVGRWIVKGPAVSSGTLADHIKADPDVVQLKQIAPDIVVLEMPASRAKRLTAELAEVVVEPDQDLDQFGEDQA